MKNKEWAVAWLANLAVIEGVHKKDLSGNWINPTTAIEMLVEAQNILEKELE